MNLTAEHAERFARLALDCVHRAYPTKIAHVMLRDEDARPPRLLTPVFYGCFDWHSAVHGHWLLARLLRCRPAGAFAAEARAALDASLTEDGAAGELAYLRGEGRGGFERPYGLAWLVTLAAECAAWSDPDGARWARVLAPLAAEAAARLAAYFARLPRPVRSGEHGQTAFSLGLALDAARATGHPSVEPLARRARDLFLGDRGLNLAFEPSAEDFLSPGLAEADLMRRVLPTPIFASWLSRFLPALADARISLRPLRSPDPSDGRLAHLDGLLLSRAWMLEGIASGLPPEDPRRPGLLAAAEEHGAAGLAAVTGEHYEGGHWLGTFAVYWLTRRGIPGARP